MLSRRCPVDLLMILSIINIWTTKRQKWLLGWTLLWWTIGLSIVWPMNGWEIVVDTTAIYRLRPSNKQSCGSLNWSKSALATTWNLQGLDRPWWMDTTLYALWDCWSVSWRKQLYSITARPSKGMHRKEFCFLFRNESLPSEEDDKGIARIDTEGMEFTLQMHHQFIAATFWNKYDLDPNTWILCQTAE